MKKVLIIDDDKDLLNGLKALLSNKGYNIQTVSEGASALPATRDFRPDAIILDVHMPDLGGKEICQQLKQNKATRKIPIIMISADSDERDILKNCPADEFLEKPFSLRMLYSKLEALTA
jgi:DNA-binding response OmpR family regulator